MLTRRPAAEAIWASVSSPKELILPRMSSEMRGRVTPRSLAALACVHFSLLMWRFKLDHQKRPQLQVLGDRGIIFNGVPYVIEGLKFHGFGSHIIP